MAFLNKGLTITLRDERADKVVDEDDEHVVGAAPAKRRSAKEVTYHYAGGIADFVRHLNATKSPIHKSVIYFEAEDKTTQQPCRSRSRCSGTRRYSESVLHLRQHHQHASRAAPTRRASGRR